LSIINPVLTVQDSASHFESEIRRTVLGVQHSVKRPQKCYFISGQVQSHADYPIWQKWCIIEQIANGK